ncbi:DUF4554 domain-containing protein isoform X2 [Gymnodraco acuticeps]|uniref:DUF4554 domain-containing protein isoform X2 n=1 Tax=Gymnodraco acuticeps TaxID=8218 RepID=A0A6P8TU33_GYMAC|nr:DUF4554 domain-containing protein isoform X2 [Gymnodraco acuticeps]
MLREIQQVLRFFTLFGNKRHQDGLDAKGGLLVLLWTDTGDSFQSLNCTVAAAGYWCKGISKELQPALKESMFSRACPPPDPDELCAFIELYGPIRLLLSFQMNDATLFRPELCARIEAFLHTYSLANLRIKTHFKFKFSQQTFQRDFSYDNRAKIKNTAIGNQWSLYLDVTCKTQPPECVKKGCWCHGGHPLLGRWLPLSVPPETMDQGLFGELSMQPVTLLRPCVLQYPNLATQLTHIQVLVYGPSNVPLTGPSIFFQNLPANLDCQDLGLCGIHCSSVKDGNGTVYTVEQEQEDLEQESVSSIQQSLLLYVFLQHGDPFASELSDMMATEVLIQRHLEDILNNNRQAVTRALQTELKDSLKAQHLRKQSQQRMRSAAKVILSSSISIVSSSSNMDFRNACLNSMKVRDTHDLSASLHESLRRVTSWKFAPKCRCPSAQVEEEPEGEDPTGREI